MNNVNADTESSLPSPSLIQRGWNLLRFLQVRLRFALVLLLVFVIVGKWPDITASWRAMLGAVSPEQAVSSSTEYFCPMCPGVLSSWPAQCAVCSMPLVRRTKGEMGILPDGSLQRMQISPYRLQLGGIATSAVQYRPLMIEEESGPRALAEIEPYKSQPRSAPPLAPKERRIVHVCPNHPRQVSTRAGRCPLDAETLAPQGLAEHERLRWQCPLHPETIASTAVPCEQCAGLPLLPVIVAYAPAEAVLAVPAGAVVKVSGTQLVYRQASAGVFDAVPVQLGAAVQGYYPVLAGLRSGDKIVTQGAFLLDAETRLDPDLAAAYFGAGAIADENSGASQAAAGTTTTSADVARLLADMKLAPQQRALALRQRICPITQMPLGCMGPPVAVQGAGQTVLLCCGGCRQRFAKLHADAQPTAARAP